MRALLTGGAGYIGSHIALVLFERGYDVVILDDFSNGSAESLRRVASITGRMPQIVEADLTDLERTAQLLQDVEFDAVIHLAGLKAVGESIASPSRYYRTNLTTTLNLLEIMREKDVRNLVFSSSATVYGVPADGNDRIDENQPVGMSVTNPYGQTKVMNERIIHDVQQSWPELASVHLRYFNPVGSHESGNLGEDPSGTPNNLMPFVAQVAVGRYSMVNVFGDTYPTPDGTGVRDYIHVMDLAEGHVAALSHLTPGVEVYNLGSGIGHSVLDVIRTYAEASGREIPYQIVSPRPGDIARLVADPSKANTDLNWRAVRSLDEACRDSWAWQSKNPLGFSRSST